MDGVFFVKGTTIEETLKHRDILDDERLVVVYAIEQRSKSFFSYTEDIFYLWLLLVWMLVVHSGGENTFLLMSSRYY